MKTDIVDNYKKILMQSADGSIELPSDVQQDLVDRVELLLADSSSENFFKRMGRRDRGGVTKVR